MKLDLDNIIQGDCLAIMRSLPDNSVDLILTDPPYHRVKAEWWDRQWDNDAHFIDWIGLLCEQWQRVLKPNGSLYCFASPRMSARVECAIGKHFNILNNIRWDKSSLPLGGRHKAACKESLRAYFPTHESIVFAEHFGADNIAKGEAGYNAKCDEIRGFVFEPIRAYLDGERKRAGVSPNEVNLVCGYREKSGLAGRHWFSSSQWELPTELKYKLLQSALPGYFLRPYEELRQQYEELRQQYEELRRPFSVSADVPYTDTWIFPTVGTYKGKHPCEKPAAMLEHIISASSKPGATVLDCFAGSGSTLLAAKKLGRNYIGIEIDAHWVEVCSQRLGQFKPKSPTLEERVAWLETQVKVHNRKLKKIETTGQLSLFDSQLGA